jgi:dGTPase
MAGHGGFNHNCHSLRVVEYLEHPYPSFRGLNLTRETREGLAQHETKFDRPDAAEQGRPSAGGGPSVEARIVSFADRIAYDCHDLEDAIGAEFVSRDELGQLGLWRTVSGQVVGASTRAPLHAIRRPVLDAMLDAILLSAVETSRPRLATIRSPDEAAAFHRPLVLISDLLEDQLCELEQLLSDRVYRHSEIVAADARSREMIHELFTAYLRAPRELPRRFFERVAEQGLHGVICDYIAGMTYRFCIRQYARLTSASRPV